MSVRKSSLVSLFAKKSAGTEKTLQLLKWPNMELNWFFLEG